MKKIKFSLFLPSLLLSLVLFFLQCTFNEKATKLELLPIFSDNMVLQQGQKVPIWGISSPKSELVVKFRDQIIKADADNQGKWLAYLEPLKVGSSDSLVIECDTLKKVFHNVAVGEVWLCSGQSNMEMNVGCTWAKVYNSAEEVQKANYPDIRLLVIEKNTAVAPVDTIKSSGWKICSPLTVGDFSAVGYFFGREIHTTQNVPVGLIQSAWGGTVAEAWTSGESLKLMKDFAGTVEKLGSMPSNKDSLKLYYEKEYNSWLLETASLDKGITGNDTVFASPDLNDSGWMKINLPGMWEGTEIGEMDGTVWFRKKINVPASKIGKNFTLSIAPPDDADETWFNGRKVGASTEWDVVRKYKLPENLVKAGENVVVVRLSDFQGAGGFMGKPGDFSLFTDDGWKISFGGEWKCHVGYNMKDVKIKPIKPGEPNIPTVLYNAMINPVIPYGIRGAIWYQGESNTGSAYQYRELFPTMIKDWRAKWGQGDFPFLFVQLANYMERNKKPVEDGWAELREAQLMTLELPSTGMAVTIDIGDAKDIHPSNKQDVGKRLSLIARNNVYKEEIPYSGPIFKSMEIKEDKIIIAFNFTYDGLSIKDSKILKGFTIAGDDKVFHWAKAIIEGDKVIVNSPDVKNPKAIRYAWSSNPECNLVNSAGLPASPFRTDDWPGLTAPDEMKK
jgi:sialate O-acetylesterase